MAQGLQDSQAGEEPASYLLLESASAMFQLVVSFVEEFLRNFRPADAVDILLMSIFIYSALIWFKESASRRMLTGVLVLVAVYFAARTFDMYLTSLVFQQGFAALVIVLIVVFQEDLRRMFERVAGWGSLRRLREPPPVKTHLDQLVETVFSMAATKTGALLVLPGRDPLDRHLQGGIELGGRMSTPLILSIFDATSPGHDGAVVMDHDRIEKFAVHLPVSRNRVELAGRGTRHGAALGLSECCDALVVVVSEERGTVCVAQEGRLKRMESAPALKRCIDRFDAEKHPQPAPATWTRYLTENGRWKLLALALAVVSWFVLAYNPSPIQRTFIVPIQYRNLPPNLVLGDGAPDEARVTLSGSERNFRFLAPETLRISIDLSKAQTGRSDYLISENSITLPPNLNVYRIDPPYIRLNLRKAGETAAPAGASPPDSEPGE